MSQKMSEVILDTLISARRFSITINIPFSTAKSCVVTFPVPVDIDSVQDSMVVRNWAGDYKITSVSVHPDQPKDDVKLIVSKENLKLVIDDLIERSVQNPPTVLLPINTFSDYIRILYPEIYGKQH